VKKVDANRALATWLRDEVASWDNNRPRSTQSLLGPSSLGGCREFIRATVVNDPGIPETGFKAAAFMGTAIGDMIEGIFAARHQAITQFEIVTKMAKTGITVAGSSDFIIPPDVMNLPEDDELAPLLNDGLLVDVKSKDGLADVERYGSSLDNIIQLGCYFIGAVQMGVLTEKSHATLMYVDRSGSQTRFSTVTIDYEEAVRWMELAEERLIDVQDVISRGSTEEDRWSLRDKPPSWCFAVQCPFRLNCWGGSDFIPSGKIEHPDELASVQKYIDARDEEKDVAILKATANKELANVSGTTPTGVTVSWTSTGRTDPDGNPALRLDVRVPR
jgi:hypothetical protein